MISSTTGEFLDQFRFEIDGYTRECPSKLTSDFLFAECQFKVVVQLKDGYKGDSEVDGIPENIIAEYIRCQTNLYFKDSARPPS